MRETDPIMPEIEGDIGEIKLIEELCPGVFYVAAREPETGLAQEYYIADQKTALLTEEAKAYGLPLETDAGLLKFPIEAERGGAPVVKYEVQRYRAAHQLAPLDDDSALLTAVYGMERYPEYFGDYPVPPMTPRGATTRHKRLASGVYALETETFERMIAVCYPVWSCDLSDYTIAQAEQLDSDARQGIDSTLGYLYFPASAGCLALFELWKWYEEFMSSGLIDRAAMMNAIYLNHPEYAVQHNRWEQEGLNDAGAQFWRWLGFDVEPEGRADNLITLYSGVGVDYLRF